MLAGSFAAPFFADRTLPIASSRIGAELTCRAAIDRIFPTSRDAARELAAMCGTCGQPAPDLIDALCSKSGDRETLASGSQERVRALLDGKIRADFRAGRTRRVDGWVLSETEIRLFSIVAAA
jgi:hypothetical protein